MTGRVADASLFLATLLLVLVLLSISSEQGLRRAPIKHMSS